MRTVDEGGAAQAAGLVPGDRIISVNGIDVMYWSHRKVVETILHCGDKVTLVVGSAQKAGAAEAPEVRSPSPVQEFRPRSRSMSSVPERKITGSNGAKLCFTIDVCVCVCVCVCVSPLFA